MTSKKSRKRSTARLEEVHRNRMENMRKLRETFPTVREFCEAIAQGQAFYYNVAGPHPVRQIGEAVSRDIEHRLKLPALWMDARH